MKATDIPTRFAEPFAKNASGTYKRTVPVTTLDPVAASLDIGFPPDTFVPVGAGGTAPDGRDVNGILFASTSWNQWQGAGGPIPYDATFATAIGGYPKGAIVASATTFGAYWLCTTDDNTTDPDAGGAGWVSFLAGGGIGTGARLVYASTTSVQLSPYNGGYLWINGLNVQVPASLTLANTALAASTLYYVYAFMSGGAMTLEASTTGYVLAANGMPQKAGDATRTLVGMVFTSADTPGQFVDASASRHVASYFNRSYRTLVGGSTNGASTAAHVPTELTAAARVTFVAWADDAQMFQCTGFSSIDTAGNTTGIAIGIDSGAPIGPTQGQTSSFANTNGSVDGQSAVLNAILAEGFHFASPFGLATNVGTAYFRVVMTGAVRG